jgi:hypothetical protein
VEQVQVDKSKLGSIVETLTVTLGISVLEPIIIDLITIYNDERNDIDTSIILIIYEVAT